ncbi:uncharacterized protein LOC128732616 [Sabethes cyaneus]|uniref:uncharacterized protein LOC128732616 n=1 Tax=Sabethes cyaneus TaxID=53552 RepID=UPI00237DB31B|nr:uncharacterized protein LOC128732616 [Sabethes cyaneus]XP_053681878.1 uncharacterized protein LOC128732616 [Sabethes cyaneus]
MSAKLFMLAAAAVVLLSGLTLSEAQTPAPAAGPTFEDLVQEREAKTLHVLNLMVAGSSAPQELKDAVLANAQQELANCVQQASVHASPGVFYSCTGLVLKNAGTALGAAASSGAAGSGL